MLERRAVTRREMVRLSRAVVRGDDRAGGPRRLVLATFTSRRALMIDLPLFHARRHIDLVVLTCPDAPLTPADGLHVVSLAAGEPLSEGWQVGAAGPGTAEHLTARAPGGQAPPRAGDPPDRVLELVRLEEDPARSQLHARLDDVEGRLPAGVTAAARLLVG